jgi:hypothetical protein
MAHLIKPGDIKVITKNNELFVNIALELNIKLDGNITSLNVEASGSAPFESKKEEDKVNWAIPDFGSTNKLKFGKET